MKISIVILLNYYDFSMYNNLRIFILFSYFNIMVNLIIFGSKLNNFSIRHSLSFRLYIFIYCTKGWKHNKNLSYISEYYVM